MDIVIPAHPKDFDVLPHAVRGVRRHVRDRDRMIVISPEDPRLRGVTWVDEAAAGAGFPSLAEVRAALEGSGAEGARAGWVLQQLIKLGVGELVDDISKRYLVIDADVIFLRTVDFDGPRFPYSRATEHQQQYLDVCERLIGDRVGTHSFTAHHMVFDRSLAAELRDELEQRHDMAWWQAILAALDPAESNGFSEWNLYGHWVLARHPDDAEHRQLFWLDVRHIPTLLGRAALGMYHDFVAVHAYRREQRSDQARVFGARLARELQYAAYFGVRGAR
jgi:hypothetical protein